MSYDKTKSGRRNFVKTSMAAAGGTLLSSFPLTAFASTASYVPKEIKIGLVGCGGRGTGAAFEALKTSPAVKLVAMGETFEDRLSQAYTQLKSEFTDQVAVPDDQKFIGFDAYQKVIEKCDVVLLATPPPFRPIHLEACVKADKHVFIEKPLFVDIPGYNKIVEVQDLAKQKNISLGVGLQLRYESGYQQMKEQLDNGIIGDIVSLNVYYNVGAPKIFPRSANQTEMNYQIRNWRYFTWLWGGQLAGQAIHQIDLMNWFMNDYPVKASGSGGRQVYSGPDQGNTYDHHYAEFEYNNKIKMHVQCRNIDNTWNKTGFQVQGTKGYADDKSQIFNSAGELLWRFRDREEILGSSEKCQAHFINSILTDKPINQLDYGIKSTLTTIMGRMAIHSGQIITLEQALTSKVSLLPKEFTWDASMPDTPGKDGNYQIPMPGKTEVI